MIPLRGSDYLDFRQRQTTNKRKYIEKNYE